MTRYDVDCSDLGVARRTPIVRVNPYYPVEAFENRTEGWVIVEFKIGPEGEVLDPTVVDSDPPGVFDAEVIETVSGWRYCPPSEALQYPESMKSRLRFER